MQLICTATGVIVDATEEAAKHLLASGAFKRPSPKRQAPKRTRKPKE